MIYRLSMLGVCLMEYALSVWIHVHFGVYNALTGYKIQDGKTFILWVMSLGFSLMVVSIMYSIKHKGE